jgi:hypothetical protein
MVTRSEAFPSKFLKASDLNGKAVIVRIAATPFEKLKSPNGVEQSKIVLSFHGTEKKLPLNMVNFDSVAAIVGNDESDNWVGLYPTQTSMAGKLTDCIRIRKPAPKSKTVANPHPPEEEEPPFNDEIPTDFGDAA